jgi:hypothetical protein
MEFDWWEAFAMLVLFAVQLVLPAVFGHAIRDWVTYAFLTWAVTAVGVMVLRRKRPAALIRFSETWRANVGA